MDKTNKGVIVDPKIIEAVATTFSVEASSLEASSGPDTVANWDSLGHLSLVAALEAAYGISFTMDEIISLQSLEIIDAIVQSKLV